MAYDSLNKQMSSILAQKPVAVLLFKGQSTRALKGFVNIRDFSYAEDFVGRIGIMLLQL